MEFRLLIGFALAPLAPACILFLFQTLFLESDKGDFPFKGLIILIYIFTVVLGIPVYYALTKRKKSSLISYGVAGFLMGIIAYMIIFVPTFIFGLNSGLEHSFGVFRNTVGLSVFSSVYGFTAAVFFWLIVQYKI